MFQRIALGKSKANFKIATANVILLATAFIWYLLAFNGLKEMLYQQNASSSETLLIVGLNTAGIAIAGLLGTFVVDRLKNRRAFLYTWIASGVALSILPLGLNVTDMTNIAVVSLTFGLYFGFGMPATMGYYSSLTTVENRAKMSGLTFLILGATFAITGLLALDSVFYLCTILAAVRLLGLIVFRFMNPKGKPEEPKQEKNKITYRKILSNKSFVFYFIPWCMFTLINFMTIPIQSNIYTSESSYLFLTAMENVVIALVAVVSGFVADKLGRKRLIIIGFIMVGIGYAVIGLFSANNADMQLGSIIFTLTDGIAWGIFNVMFLFTLWGDLAQNGNSDKIYFIGALPYVSSYFMELFFAPYLSEIEVTTIFSFASVFLFLAVLPLVYAPETLPEKVMKDRDLKSYVERAKKKAQKDTEKMQKKEKASSINNHEETNEPTEDDKNYEKEKKLAEKYY